MLLTILEDLVKRAGRVGNRGTSRDHPNYNIVEVSQNTEKSPGNQTPEKDYKPRLV